MGSVTSSGFSGSVPGHGVGLAGSGFWWVGSWRAVRASCEAAGVRGLGFDHHGQGGGGCWGASLITESMPPVYPASCCPLFRYSVKCY